MPLRIRRHVTAGLLVLVPLVLTAVAVNFIFDLIDGWARPLTARAVGRPIPGVGLALTFLAVYLAGLLSTNLFGKKVLELIDGLFQNVPLVKTLYTGAKQLVEAVSPGGRRAFRKVVLVEFPKKGTLALAFVTGDGIGPSETKMLTVYVPTAINPTSGFVLFVPESEVIDPGLSIEEGIKLVVSGGVVAPPRAVRGETAS
jgi:uncharacterized membrane protein